MSETFEVVARRALAGASRNRHIPKDIWDAATAAANAIRGLREDADDDNLPLEIEIIAKVLFAERETCAQVVGEYPENLGLTKGRLVTAIRNRGEG